MTRIPRRTLLAAALGAAIAVGAPLAQAADAPITIMVGGINKIIYLPAKLTEALGYFKEEGLNVELQSQPAGVDAENQLIAGAVQGVVGFYDHTIDLQSKGKEVEAIVVFGKVPGEVEMVSTKAAPTFKSMADAKGKTLGVTGLGSSTDFLTRYLALRQGVESKDYSLLPVGAGNSFIAAIKQDRIQAGMTTEPTISQLLKTGDAQVLVDMRTEEGTRAALGGLYPASSLYVANSWADANKAQAMLIHNTASCSAMQTAVQAAASARNNAGLVYATEREFNYTTGVGNPWAALPVYWEALVQTVDAVNTGASLPRC